MFLPSIDCRRTRFFSSPEYPDQLWSSPSLPFTGFGGSSPVSPGEIGRGVNLISYYHPMLRLRTVGAINLLPYFMTWTGTASPYNVHVQFV